MNELTICANCRFYVPACESPNIPRSLWASAMCTAHEHQEVDVVTGNPRYVEAVRCKGTNDGHCPDYVWDGIDHSKAAIIKAPQQKHWWQR